MSRYAIPAAGLACALALAVSACGHLNREAAEEAAREEAAAEIAAVDAALAHPDRFAGDAEDDERRRARETLLFSEIDAGDTVFEIEAGGGYWTELYSYLVGPDGEVVMQNPQGFLQYVQDVLDARFADDRLDTVRQSISVFDDLDAEDGSVDVATWIQGPHEPFYRPEDGSDLGDADASFAEIFRILRPGGVFLAVDHSALAGSPSETGHTLHRIDPAIVIEMAEAAGFVLEGDADFLANPEDDLSISVFAPQIRGRTDQFVLRFRKPE